MKNKIKGLFIIAILIALLAPICHAEQFAGWDKMDIRARQFVERTVNNDVQMDIIIKTVKPAGWYYKMRFKRAGFKYRSIIKNIITGNIAVSNINKLAGLDFVERIELSVPLDIKR